MTSTFDASYDIWPLHLLRVFDCTASNLTYEMSLFAQSELLSGVDAVKGAAKKALAAQEHSVEHSTATAASLQGLKQVLVVR
jgi:hypothetical protein